MLRVVLVVLLIASWLVAGAQAEAARPTLSIHRAQLATRDYAVDQTLEAAVGAFARQVNAGIRAPDAWEVVWPEHRRDCVRQSPRRIVCDYAVVGFHGGYEGEVIWRRDGEAEVVLSRTGRLRVDELVYTRSQFGL